MTGGISVVLLSDERCDVAAVERALDDVDVRTTSDTAEAVEALPACDCVVATSTARGRELLGATDGDLAVPVVVLTDDHGDRIDNERVQHHRTDDLATLQERVRDAVLADRERRRADARASGSAVDPADHEELAEREAAYRTLVENIPSGGVSLFDRDLRYTWVGGEVFDQIDLDPEAVVGKTIHEVHSERFVDAYKDDYRAVFDGERSTFEFEYRDRQFVSDLVPIRENGEVVAGMTMTRDVTEERERQHDLQVKTRAMDAAAIGLVLTDPTQPDNPLVYVNEGYQEMTGYDAEEVLGKNPRHLQGPETEEEPNERMREAVENAEPCAVEITNYRKDGTPFVNHVEITPIFDDEGDLVHFLGSQVDVTERHERERALARKNEQLEEFASVVSHDLRSPLAVVRGSVDLARNTGDLGELDRAETTLDRMDELVDDLLALAREGRAIDPDSVEPVSIADAAREAWATVDTTGATLSVVDDDTVDADPTRLRQLLENLFRNSVEHGSTSHRLGADDSVEHGSTGSRTPSDDSVEHGVDDEGAHGTDTEPTTDLNVRVGALDGDDCGFFVEDDGTGVPRDLRDRVLDAGVTTAQTGTGFGLAIVRQVAEAHGWAIRVTESASGGARFEFRVRCVDDRSTA
ncbi:hybrid sensor histidine kinase/response regulator [Salinigranum salinum]|uniref:hybrid sensor histidine kinase/response regulator n=1 Tax=Salinigranum salinum TaxID=1364937 RepID=UPI00126123D6|nr:PAS domain S-box protein [Salinigranum salinum]